MRRHKRAVIAAQNEIGNYMTDLEAHWGQFVHAVAERDAAIAEVQGIHAERDEAIRLVESREAT